MPGLGTSFGRGGSTTAPSDLINADAILIIGSSMAEAHPVAFRWVVRARERGTWVAHVDPRFSRTSAHADVWAPLRAGSDIVFLGGLIRFALEHDRVFREYVAAYTNAPYLLREDFRGPEDLEGLFSGWQPGTDAYETSTWQFDRTEDGTLRRDDTLTHSRSVFQQLRRHFARYTPDMVERTCGVPAATFLTLADRYTAASGADRTGTICYAVGLTQHSVGVQVVRSAAILQLLLGNVGRPGGGILALRGHASIQGSTDIPTLYDLLPGYLPMPAYGSDAATLDRYISAHRTPSGGWSRFNCYIVSLLKAWYGDAATAEHDFGFGWVPRISGDHSHQGYWLDMADGRMDGLFVMGQNPAVGGPNAALERRALGRLKWLVVRDMVEVETATFWRDAPEVRDGKIRPEQIGTEVFLLPAAGHAEKDGCFTNTQRLVQWHEKAVDPPGDCRSDGWFVFHLGRRLKERAARDTREWNDGLRALTWDYPLVGPHAEPDMEKVLEEINGRHVTTGTRVDSFTELGADGSTASGCWIYSGIFPSRGPNRARNRSASGPYAKGWGYAWPLDRRVLYNRASARPDGAPWSDRKTLVWWDEDRSAWTGFDVPDMPQGTGPGSVGDGPFAMHADGLGRLFVPSGLKDGPFPSHYEPLESPTVNVVYRQQTNPAARRLTRPDNTWASSPDPEFPHVLTTYRLTEHHTAGGMSRTLAHLAELQPALFCELSPELAREIDLRPGDRVAISTARGRIVAHALVTARIRPLIINGHRVHQVAMPWHFGHHGLVTGDVANDLIPMSEEPNVKIMESKALLCRLERLRASAP